MLPNHILPALLPCDLHTRRTDMHLPRQSTSRAPIRLPTPTQPTTLRPGFTTRKQAHSVLPSPQAHPSATLSTTSTKPSSTCRRNSSSTSRQPIATKASVDLFPWVTALILARPDPPPTPPARVQGACTSRLNPVPLPLWARTRLQVMAATAVPGIRRLTCRPSRLLACDTAVSSVMEVAAGAPLLLPLRPKAPTVDFQTSRPALRIQPVCFPLLRCFQAHTATRAVDAPPTPWTPRAPRYVTLPTPIPTAQTPLTRLDSVAVPPPREAREADQPATIHPISWTSARRVKHQDLPIN